MLVGVVLYARGDGVHMQVLCLLLGLVLAWLAYKGTVQNGMMDYDGVMMDASEKR